MELRTFTIKSHCVADDETLYANINYALMLSLPVLGQHFPHDITAIFVGSGPSVSNHLNEIRTHQESGLPIVAIKDAHDWLIENGITPDYAVAVDPQEHRFDCFTLKNSKTKYFIASQCHANMFSHLEGAQVYLWHLYVRKDQAVPPHGTPLIAGGTTTGLRAITLFYTLGFRNIELYGFDSCLKDGKLRMNGTEPRPEDKISEIVVNDEYFYCNPGMAAQASEFQNFYQTMPDLTISSHGAGLITAIIKARQKMKPLSISFIHSGNQDMASYRYRAMLPARELYNASINNMDADVLIFCKPNPSEIPALLTAKEKGKRVIVDFCDDHFDRYSHYAKAAKLADAVTAPTKNMADIVKKHTGIYANVIHDPYEMDELTPHCNGDKLLWFGHRSNYYSLDRILRDIAGYPLTVMSNYEGTVPWSLEALKSALTTHDIVLLPATAGYKSPNRALEAIRSGCFVVAEPHPAINDFPGIWIGNIKKGIEWATQNKEQANLKTLEAQSFVTERYSPKTAAYAWSQVILGQNSILEVETATGTDG